MITYAEAFRTLMGGTHRLSLSTNVEGEAGGDAKQHRMQDRVLDFLGNNNATATIAWITAIGFVASVIFNFGFVSAWNVEALWLFTPGDYAMMAVPLMLFIAILQVVVAVLVAIIYVLGVLLLAPISLLSWVVNRIRKSGFSGRGRRSSAADDATAGGSKPGSARQVANITVFYVYIFLAAGNFAVFGLTAIRILLETQTIQLAQSGAFAFFGLSALFWSAAFMAPAISWLAHILSESEGEKQAHYLNHSSNSREFIRSYMRGARPWVLFGALFALLFSLPIMGAGAFHSNQHALEASEAKCEIIDGSNIVSSACHLRSLERGAFRFSEDASQVFFDHLAYDQIVQFTAPAELTETWADTIAAQWVFEYIPGSLWSINHVPKLYGIWWALGEEPDASENRGAPEGPEGGASAEDDGAADETPVDDAAPTEGEADSGVGETAPADAEAD